MTNLTSEPKYLPSKKTNTTHENISLLQEPRRAYCERCGYKWWTRPWRYKKGRNAGHEYPLRCPQCHGWCTADFLEEASS